MHKLTLFLVAFTSSCFSLFGQISPPGLGKANTAGWFALGLRQGLDSANQKQSMTYFGLGRISDPDNYNPYKKSAILVINQEFYNQFHRDWQYSFALSYRRQNEYKDTPPYEEDSPPFKQEFRFYGRYSYVLKKSRLKFVATYRQEFRKFFTPEFKNWNESFQLRSRLRAQLTLNLDKNKIHRIITSAEALFSLSRENSKQWSDFDYRESRFCLYYSHSPKRSPFVFNLGYMNNLIGKQSFTDVHYLALDIIWENPFVNLKRKKEKPLEYLE